MAFTMNSTFLSAVTAALLLTPAAALAQKPADLPGNYPSKPVRVLIGLSAGGGVDILVRAMTARLGEKWKSSIVVENRPTAGGVAAMDAVAQAAPDGHTWLASGSQLELTVVFQRARFDVLKAIEPMVQMTSQPYLLVVHTSVPARTVKELIAYARARPGELNYATAGPGSAGHIGHELFNNQAGVRMTHVPYKGGGASVTDLASGRVQLSFLTTLLGSSMVKQGSVRALAVTALKRLDVMPDLPTVSESGLSDFEMSNNYGMFITAQTPMAIIAAVNKDITQVLQAADMKAKLAADGAEAVGPHPPAAYRARVELHIKRFSQVVKESGIDPNS